MAAQSSLKKRLKSGDERHVKKPRNYAETYRRTKGFHSYSFKLPRRGPLKEDVERISQWKEIQDMYASGQFTNKEVEARIRRLAIDAHIDRKLSHQQKAAITRTYYGTKHEPGLETYVKSVEDKDAVFVKFKNAKRRMMLRTMKATNAGFFILEKGIKARVIGKGRNTRVDITRLPEVEIEPGVQIFKRKEVFFPFPRGVIIPDYINMLYDKWKPDGVSIGVMSAHGSISHGSITGLNYIADVLLDYETRGRQHPFSGVYFYWF